jgi:uncharacterized membrane protein
LPVDPPTSFDRTHALRWLEREIGLLGASERRALEHVLSRRPVSSDPLPKLQAQSTHGERLADAVARLGGSWTFIAIFMAALLGWILINSRLLASGAFDPYPYIFLNLLLSMLAALQAPVIMMSQNRQAAVDRQMAAHDYEVNLKAEMEIMALHEKMDALRTEQLAAMLAKQEQQIELLTKVLGRAEIIRSG